MKKEPKAYIKHILKAIRKIDKYVSDINFSTFKADEMRQDAIIRQLEIIGEAVNRLPKNFSKTNPDFPVKEAISMRNFLIHGYDEIDLKVVWKTVNDDIPQLKRSIANLS